MTNNLITLTIPNDDHIALRAFGKALEEMALAHGAEPVQLQTYCNVTMNDELNDQLRQKLKNVLGEARDGDIDVTRAMVEQCAPEVDTTAQQVESLAQRQQPLGEDFEKVLTENLSDLYVESEPTTDSTGTPWDERIHSASKALNTDGTWRLRRKPKDMDEAEWAALVESVKLELNHGEAIREAMDKAERGEAVYYTSEEAEQKMEEFKESVRQNIEPPVTPPGDDFHTDAGVVTEQTVAGIPPIPVPPPVVVPPVPEVTEWDFPKLMKFLTERHGKIDVPTVNQLLAVDGLAALTDLNAHPAKIGPFVARVKAHLGE